MCKRMLGNFAVPLLLFFAMPSRHGWALTPPEGFAPGPDVIMGNLPTMIQAGSNGTQVGLMMGTDICNNGDVQVNWFHLPETDHPVIPQNLYRMSGGANNNDRFEQIGQSWAMHQFFPLQQNACGFGCTASPDSAHLGVGCSTSDTATLNGSPQAVGSRAWINPFTGLFPATSNTHTGHTHDGTSHRILVEGNDLNPAMNPGATYYGEAQLVTPHEYAWCQSHPGQCNMFNNVSYRQFNVVGTTSFNFSPVGATVQMTPAIFAWPGATIQTIEPAPGVDGRAFIAYKVTGPVAGIYHYEYAIYNQNLDRGIQSFRVPMLLVPGASETIGPQNIEFHAPPQHPGFPADGTLGDAGFSSAEWPFSVNGTSLTWSSETFKQNPNANAIRWGTLYNFRLDSTAAPQPANATIGFFKTGVPIDVAIQGPGPTGGPFPTPTVPPSATPSPTFDPPPTPTVTATATATATASATPTATICGELLSEHFDNVTAPALPTGWSSADWVTSTTDPDTAPNDAFVNAPAFVSDRRLDSVGLFVVSSSASVAFRNNYNLESSGSGEYFDGGVLEISSPNINGGAFTDVTDSAVGGNLLFGGYDGRISTDFLNPLAGRYAWSGNSGGYINTLVNLGPNVNGQTIRLRFRMGSDFVGRISGGWRIDTISFGGVCHIVLPTPSPTASPNPPPTPTPTPTPSGTPGPTATPAQALNISTRMRVETGDRVLIGGFIITENPSAARSSAGSEPRAGRDSSGPSGLVKTLAIRGIGPSLAQFAIPGFLTDPTIELRDSTGHLFYSNDNWLDSPSQAAVLTALGLGLQHPNESGVIINLSLGSYTVILAGKNGGTGVGLVEIYDTNPGGRFQLANVSTRGHVQAGDNVMIGGFILGGDSGHTQLAVRGIGPSLATFPFPNALADPTLELHDGNGALLISNDDWQSDPAMAAQLSAHGLALSQAKESGIFVTLPPGIFTAILAGKNGGTGIGLVEIYNLGAP